jgi:hypothetical protein
MVQKACQTRVFAATGLGERGGGIFGDRLAVCEYHAEPLLDKGLPERRSALASSDFDGFVKELLVSFAGAG